MEEALKKKGWSLQGMIALVTGGTKGIGRAIVEELAEFGAIVHTCARNKAVLDQCLHEWKQSGLNVTGSVCDVSERASCQKLMEEVALLFQGKLNILNAVGPESMTMINNAAISLMKPATEFTAEDFSLVMATNFESGYHLSQLAHPLLKASGQGNIIFISSIAGLVGTVAGALYSASKGAMNQLTKNLACEWAKDNIRTNCVAPWATKTDMLEDFVPDKDTYSREIISRTPLRRVAEPRDTSSLVAFLCLPVASYITGQIILVDGGFTVYGFYPATD